MPFSYLAAFLGGLISLLSPCSALVLPGFFATVLGQRGRLWRAALLFSLGVLALMLPLGFGFKALLFWLNSYRLIITRTIGLILIIEGLFQFRERSLFSRLNFAWPKSAFALGFFSGLGSLACIGPVLGAIITLAASSGSSGQVLGLILSYTLGIVGPLLLLAKWRPLQLGRRRWVHVLAGVLYLFLGWSFWRYQGSLGLAPVFNQTGILNWFFDLQDKLFTL